MSYLPVKILSNTTKAQSQSKKTNYPRTPADFERIDHWVMVGLSSDSIAQLMSREWRSEVVQLPTEDLACSVCFQLIYPTRCNECGQTRN